MSKCDSGPFSSTKSAPNNRVESPPRNSEPNLWDMGNSTTVDMFTTVHNTHLPHVSNSGASSTGDRCSVTSLAGEVDVHVFTIPPAQQSHSEAKDHPGWSSDTNCPLVAVTIVVPTSSMSVCGPPSHHSVPPGPTVTTVCIGWQIIPFARMDALTQHYQAAGFSREASRLAVAPKGPSTNRLYDDR